MDITDQLWDQVSPDSEDMCIVVVCVRRAYTKVMSGHWIPPRPLIQSPSSAEYGCTCHFAFRLVPVSNNARSICSASASSVPEYRTFCRARMLAQIELMLGPLCQGACDSLSTSRAPSPHQGVQATRSPCRTSCAKQFSLRGVKTLSLGVWTRTISCGGRNQES